MTAGTWLLLLAVALLVLWQLTRALPPARAVGCWLAGLGAVVAGTLLLESRAREDAARRPDAVDVESVSSDTCVKCHESHHASWHRTYHRTMTREATQETVKGDFNDATYTYLGVPTRLTREGDRFFMETADFMWKSRTPPDRPDGFDPARVPRRRFPVARLVGSHWFQEYMTRDDQGRYFRLPVSYHIVEKRWVHTNGAFLGPDTTDFWDKSTIWNETCVFCHNTRVTKAPQPPSRRGAPPGYRTEVAELGISCEACHGPGAEHVRVNSNPARRYATRAAGAGDPTIVNPRRLPVEAADQICAHCHGALVPRPEAWDRRTVADPYLAGQNLLGSYSFFWSEAEQALLARGRRDEAGKRPPPAPDDGRFWGDGTPLTTAVEYQGMALSACYENGKGRLSCLTCHSGHADDPNFMLKPNTQTNEACYQCHEGYRGRLAEHTHHAADSPGSLCYNCHMPYQVYSLLTTHRSHRIQIPRVRDSVGTGKPHACNLCHLDRSLGWTQEQLGKWYGTPPGPLPDEDRGTASSVVQLCRDDGRTRAVVAGAFSWPAAQQASGRDWPGAVLPHLLGRETYPAVRYLLHRGLRSLHGDDANPYDHLAAPIRRAESLKAVRDRLAACCRPAPARYPDLPLTPAGGVDEAALENLLKRRRDPDVSIHE